MNLPPIDIKKFKRKRRTDPLEKDIETRVCRYAESMGIRQEKYTSPNKASVPDRIFYPGGGRHFFIEFKRKGEKPTEKQARDHAARREIGDRVYVIDTVDEGMRVIDLEWDLRCKR